MAKSLFNNSFDQVNDYSVKYEDYSPIDLGKNNVHYDQIKFALENEKIKNLAILGPYGSGKSSLIFSFFLNEKVHGKLVRNDEYVTISLPDFNYVSTDESKNQCQDTLKRDDDTSAANGISKGSQQKDAELSLNKVENEIVRQLFQSSLAKCNRFANTLKNYPSKFECLIYTAIFLIVVLLFY